MNIYILSGVIFVTLVLGISFIYFIYLFITELFRIYKDCKRQKQIRRMNNESI